MMEDNIPGFIGYHITKDGELYSRHIERSPNKFGKWHKLKLSKKNRVKVRLYNGSVGYTRSISRLVALVYVYNPNPSKFNEVMHLDNNPLNNHYKNLQWGTHSMNIQQMIFEQRRKSFKTTQNPNWENFKISDRKRRRLKRLLNLGKSRLYVSKRLKVSRKTLYNFIHRIQIRNSLE